MCLDRIYTREQLDECKQRMYLGPYPLAPCYKAVKIKGNRLIPLFNGMMHFAPGWNNDPDYGHIQKHEFAPGYRKGFHCFTSRETAATYINGRDTHKYRWRIVKVLIRESDVVAGGIQRSGVSLAHETIVVRSFYLPESEYKGVMK